MMDFLAIAFLLFALGLFAGRASLAVQTWWRYRVIRKECRQIAKDARAAFLRDGYVILPTLDEMQTRRRQLEGAATAQDKHAWRRIH